MPSYVLVAPGASSATFTFGTSFVASETAMTVIGSYNGASAVALLTLEPSPCLTVAPTSLGFGSQPIGAASVNKTVTITNSGTAPLALNSETLSSGQVFRISANSCAGTLAAGANCSVSVVFNPTAAQSVVDSLQISYGNPSVIQPVPLTGTGGAPSLTFSPASINLGSQAIATAVPVVVTLSNVGSAPLSAITASITGANAQDFSIISDGCSGTVLPANFSCLVTVAFSPQVPGRRNAMLSVSDNGAGSPQTVSLIGGLAAQSISFATITAQDLGASLALNATASSGLPVTFSSATANVCSVSGSTALFTALGTCTITASQGGNADYLSAAAVAQSFEVNSAGNLFTQLQFIPVTPCRIADTRWPNAPFGGPKLSSGTARDFRDTQ